MNTKQFSHKEHFIDPRWSMLQVKNHLMETVFSEENMSPTINIVSQNFFKYRRQFLFWETKRNENELYLIFPPLNYTGKYPAKLLTIPYCTYDQRKVKIMYYTVFNYRNHKGVAVLIEDDIVIYTWHCIDRYAIRVWGVHPSKVTDEMVVEMLIYNNMSYVCRLEDNISPCQIYDIVRDGIYGCEFENGIIVRKTFLNNEMLSPIQVRFKNDKLKFLNEHLKRLGIPKIDEILTDELGRVA